MLIETKLRPPVLKSHLVERLDLIVRLDEIRETRMAVISAPAGFGKSTLIGQWLKLRLGDDDAAGWLSIDGHDNEFGRFVTYFVAAINRADSSIGTELLTTIMSSPVVPTETILSSLANALSLRRGHLFLVLDDCHLVDHPDIAEFLNAFVTYAPANFHLLLATRGSVPVRVTNMRVRGHLVWLDESSLRFSLGETRRFLDRMLVEPLPAEDVIFLQHRTEGWIAGLQLASLSLNEPEGRREFIRRFSGTDRDVAEFLLQDVLARQPAEVMSFLLATSILERFDAGLADAVTGKADGQSMIEHVERSNLFLIALDRDRGWYRYHHLFSELLRSILQKSQPSDLRALHLRAARWLSDNDLIPDAVQHALAAGHADLAVNLVERCCMPLIRQGHITRVSEWLNHLPMELVSQRPRLELARVWVLFHMSRARPAAAILRRVRDSIVREAASGLLSEREKSELIVELQTLTAGVISAADRSARAVRLGRSWLAGMADSHAFCKGTLSNIIAFSELSIGKLDAARLMSMRGRDCHDEAGSVLGVVYSELLLGLTERDAGDLGAASEHFRRAVSRAVAELGPGSYAEAMVAVFEAELQFEWGDIDRAETLLQTHRQVIEECGLIIHEMACKLLSARIAEARGRHDDALSILERAERQGIKTRYRRMFAMALHERIRLVLERGDLTAARLVLRARGLNDLALSGNMPDGPTFEPELIALSRIAIAEGRPEAALRDLARLADRLVADGRKRRLCQVRALMAIAAHQAGDGLSCLDAVSDAFGLAAAGKMFGTLVDEGTRFRAVIEFSMQRLRGFQPGGAHHDLARKVLARMNPAESPARPSVQVRRDLNLSGREFEVARKLSAGVSNRDIAEALSMSVDTVKWHLKNVFGKLAVSNRTEAVIRLRELGIGTTTETGQPSTRQPPERVG